MKCLCVGHFENKTVPRNEPPGVENINVRTREKSQTYDEFTLQLNKFSAILEFKTLIQVWYYFFF